MKIAITGGTGFVGKHLAQALLAAGHEIVVISRGQAASGRELRDRPGVVFHQSDLGSVASLTEAFRGCEAVAHCAGINREVGAQTYQRIHIDGTRHVVEAAKAAGVNRVVFTSYLRARPDCGSGYLESKFAAEELIRQSGLEYTLLRVGILYGHGDHMISHLHFALSTLPVFGLVSLRDVRLRPVAIEDFVDLMQAALVENTLVNQTVAVTGPEEMPLREAARRVAQVLKKSPLYLPTPLWMLYAMAWLCERVMREPLVAVAQVRMLSEGITEPVLPCDPLSEGFAPQSRLDEARIRAALL